MHLVEDLAVTIPVLPSLSIAQTRDFYTRMLGFSEVVYEASDYLIVRRSHARIGCTVGVAVLT